MGYYDFLYKEIEKQNKLRRKNWEDWAKARQGALEGGMGGAGTLYSGMFQKGTYDIQKAMAEGVAQGESQADLEIAKIKAQDLQERQARKAALAQGILTAIGAVGGTLLAPGIGTSIGATLGSIAGRAVGGTQEALEGIPSEIVSGINMLSDNDLLKVYQDIYTSETGKELPSRSFKFNPIWNWFKKKNSFNPYSSRKFGYKGILE